MSPLKEISKSLTVIGCKQTKHLHESQELLRPNIHKCAINYSCLNTNCRAFTSPIYEKIMHFNWTSVYVHSLCKEEQTSLCMSVCVSVCVFVCVWNLKTHLTQKLCRFHKVFACAFISSLTITAYLSVGNTHTYTHTHTCMTHTPAHSPTINTDWQGALPPSFIFISRLPRALIAFASPSPGTPTSLNYKIIQGQLILL